MYINSIAYTVAAVGMLISATAQPLPNDSTAAAVHVARTAPGINPINGLPAPRVGKHHHKHPKHLKHPKHHPGKVHKHGHKQHHHKGLHKHPHPKHGHSHKHHKHHHSGDLTYYAPGLGSCGITSSGNELVVAVAEHLMAPHDGGNPNDNPWCGKHIHIHANGKSHKAKIVDKCPGCARGGLDASPALFKKFADLGVGRVAGMHWTFA